MKVGVDFISLYFFSLFFSRDVVILFFVKGFYMLYGFIICIKKKVFLLLKVYGFIFE